MEYSSTTLELELPQEDCLLKCVLLGYWALCTLFEVCINCLDHGPCHRVSTVILALK
jgi:hypothetical protein